LGLIAEKLSVHTFILPDPASSEISDLRNRWLHAICACAEWYSRSCIRKRWLFTEISNRLAENWWL